MYNITYTITGITIQSLKLLITFSFVRLYAMRRHVTRFPWKVE